VEGRPQCTIHVNRVLACTVLCLMCLECCAVWAVLLVVGFSALVAALWCIGACRCQRGRLRSRGDSPWKQVPSDNFQLRNDGCKPLLVGDEEEDDAA